VVGQPGQLQRVAEPAAFAEADFLFQEQVDEVEISHLAGLGTLDKLGEGVGEVGESEPGGMVPDPVSGQGARRIRRSACGQTARPHPAGPVLLSAFPRRLG
jgi:hypothetical protein